MTRQHTTMFKNPESPGFTVVLSEDAPRWLLNKGAMISPCFFCKSATPKGDWYVRVPSMRDPVCAYCCERVGLEPRRVT